MAVTDLSSMPLKMLRQNSILALCDMLDPYKPNRNNYLALVDYLGISYDELKRLQKQSDTMRIPFKSITLLLLRKWCTLDIEKANVQLLIDLLEKVERLDVIKEIEPFILDDLEKVKEDGKDGKVSPHYGESCETLWDNIVSPRINDMLFSSDLLIPGYTFDGLISYNPQSEDDQSAMLQLKHDLDEIRLPKQCERQKLMIVVGADELLPGNDRTAVLSRAIRYRCKHVILLISHSFIKCDECVFQMQIGKSLDLTARSRKIIPVIIEKNVRLPDEIGNLNAIDLTNPAKRNLEINKLAISLL